jgi:hypothetical protein
VRLRSRISLCVDKFYEIIQANDTGKPAVKHKASFELPTPFVLIVLFLNSPPIGAESHCFPTIMLENVDALLEWE